jgi:predicted enzyme related to lactoylglutathione lyase
VRIVADCLVLTLDVTDPDLQGAFWCAAGGYEVTGGVAQYRVLTRADGALPKLLLQQVPEAKSAKNRLHLDLHVPDVEAEAARLEALGARRLARTEEFGLVWVTMADPEGNEFCLAAS